MFSISYPFIPSSKLSTILFILSISIKKNLYNAYKTFKTSPNLTNVNFVENLSILIVSSLPQESIFYF